MKLNFEFSLPRLEFWLRTRECAKIFPGHSSRNVTHNADNRAFSQLLRTVVVGRQELWTTSASSNAFRKPVSPALSSLCKTTCSRLLCTSNLVSLHFVISATATSFSSVIQLSSLSNLACHSSLTNVSFSAHPRFVQNTPGPPRLRRTKTITLLIRASHRRHRPPRNSTRRPPARQVSDARPFSMEPSPSSSAPSSSLPSSAPSAASVRDYVSSAFVRVVDLQRASLDYPSPFSALMLSSSSSSSSSSPLRASPVRLVIEQNRRRLLPPLPSRHPRRRKRPRIFYLRALTRPRSCPLTARTRPSTLSPLDLANIRSCITSWTQNLEPVRIRSVR